MAQYKALPTLSFPDAMSSVITNLFKFKGRARRSEFWWAQLVVLLVSIPLTPFAGFILDVLCIPLAFRRLHDTGKSGWWWLGAPILFLITLGMLVRDIIWLLVAFGAGTAPDGFAALLPILSRYLIAFGIHLLYRIIMIVFMLQDSDKGANKYGASPKYVEVTEEAGEVSVA